MKRMMKLALALLLIPAVAQGADSKFVTGDSLGKIMPEKASFALSATGAAQDIAVRHFGLTGEETMDFVGASLGDKGFSYLRFQENIDGLPVVGATIVLKIDADGNVVRANGELAAAGLSSTPTLSAAQAFMAAFGKVNRAFDGGELTFVLDAKGAARLAWKFEHAYDNADGAQLDHIFVDAHNGSIAATHPKFHYARSLQTLDCNQRTRCNTVVSTSSNAINTGDLAADSAHNYAIATYDYYAANHGRDSIDDAGMTLISRVHYNRNYNNAFWDGSQMTYGDGDGTTFIPLSQDADVVAHELTHGVTERSSGLIYSNESGALNEALSDIFGAMVDRQEGANTVDTWLLGEDIYTPGTPGDALRVMNDPAAAGDYDYYPTRYTGTSDNGGVHWNSGIANLAYVLLVEGGSHPRGKTSVNVSGIGFDKAAAIFYAANTGCLTAASNFAAARGCTADAAATLYGAAEEASVHAAWDAVGVPYPTPPAPPIALVDGQPVALELGAGETQAYTLEVGAGASSVTFTTAGANGDADLYVKFGQTATRNNADCVSESSNSNETCTISSPAEGTWHASVFAFSAFTGLTMTGETGGGGSCSAQGDSCSAGTDCCSGSCSGGKPSSRVCL